MSIKNQFEHYKYLGYDKETLEKCRPELDKDNLHTICNVSLLLIVILSIITSFYLLFDNKPVRNLICIISGLLLVVIFLMGKRLIKNPTKCSPAKVTVLMNGFLFLCFGVGIYLGTFAANGNMAVAPVWMFFFAILVFNNLPIQNTLALAFYGCLYSYACYITKDSTIFRYDIMHGVTSIIASGIMSWSKTRLKVQNIMSVKNLKKTNDAISQTIEVQEREAALLRHKAQRDEMTGLYKKHFFQQKVMEVIAESNNEAHHGLACIDIDNFKEINDSFGHMFGDDVLKDVVNAIKPALNSHDFAGRFGGDEFIVFINDYKNIKEVRDKMSKIISSYQTTYTVENKSQPSSVSIGVSLFPDDAITYSALFENADKALYYAKQNGKGKCCFYKDVK